MTQGSNGKVPIPTLERLATYLRFLIDLQQSNVDTISSAEVERQTGVNAAQFRKDLNWFGDFGKPGVGYNVQDLQARITRILKIDREQRIILVGAGNLGSALVGYPGLQEHRFNLVAVFDNNYGKIGRPLWNLEIQDVQRLKEVNSVLGARIAILAVPAPAAQKVADLLVEAGIRAILNFAPVLLRKPDNVYVRNVSFLQELAVLSYHLSGEGIASDIISEELMVELSGSPLDPILDPSTGIPLTDDVLLSDVHTEISTHSFTNSLVDESVGSFMNELTSAESEIEAGDRPTHQHNGTHGEPLQASKSATPATPFHSIGDFSGDFSGDLSVDLSAPGLTSHGSSQNSESPQSPPAVSDK